jgi:hypothetical protein
MSTETATVWGLMRKAKLCLWVSPVCTLLPRNDGARFKGAPRRQALRKWLPAAEKRYPRCHAPHGASLVETEQNLRHQVVSSVASCRQPYFRPNFQAIMSAVKIDVFRWPTSSTTERSPILKIAAPAPTCRVEQLISSVIELFQLFLRARRGHISEAGHNPGAFKFRK